MYTGPGYLSAFLGVVIFILLIFVFRESKLTNARKREKMKKTVEYEDGSVQSSQKISLLSSESVPIPLAAICHVFRFPNVPTPK